MGKIRVNVVPVRYLTPSLRRPQVEVKEVVSITFPPTQEPTIIPPGSLETTGDVTPDPFDQYYEDYDTEDLPPLDLDLPRPGQGQTVPTPPLNAPDRPEQVSNV